VKEGEVLIRKKKFVSLEDYTYNMVQKTSSRYLKILSLLKFKVNKLKNNFKNQNLVKICVIKRLN